MSATSAQPTFQIIHITLLDLCMLPQREFGLSVCLPVFEPDLDFQLKHGCTLAVSANELYGVLPLHVFMEEILLSVITGSCGYSRPFMQINTSSQFLLTDTIPLSSAVVVISVTTAPVSAQNCSYTLPLPQPVTPESRLVRLPNNKLAIHSDSKMRQLVRDSLVAAFLKSANAADIISFQLLRSISRCNMIQDLECVAVHLFAVEFFRHWVGRDINVWESGRAHNVTVQAQNIYDVLGRQKSFFDLAKRVKSGLCSFGFKGRSSDLQSEDIQRVALGQPQYGVIRILDAEGRKVRRGNHFTH